MSQENYDLGIVTSLDVSADGEDPDIFWLVAHTGEGERVGLKVTEGVARTLWAQLTKILYPRAADQLTQRAETVVRSRVGEPSITHLINTVFKPDDELIEVSGLSRAYWWTMYFTPAEGDELWAVLEDIFGAVGGGR
jgi:hypothetical protein